MIDVRPIGYVIGLVVAVLGATMVFPFLLDLLDGNGHWTVFALSGLVSLTIGGVLSLSCANATGSSLTLQQTFVLTTLIWIALPLFGALPFVFGATDARFIDAFFESVSGMTTTGSTVFSGLETLPRGLLLWRGLLQWFGGVGIIVVAMVFLPTLKSGGMQIFRTEAFDTLGKILPRAAEIATRISIVYFALTAACFWAYVSVGLSPFDALVHAMTTLSTGGFSNYDRSFGTFSGNAEYVAALFMLLASLPFVRYVQLMGGAIGPVFRDAQTRGYLKLILLMTLSMIVFRLRVNGDHFEHSLRESLFNVVSIVSGTGYSSVDYQLWGAFPIAVFFLGGLIGGCAGSTACSVKIFRYQLLIASLKSQIRRLHSPNGVFVTTYDGHSVGRDVMSSVMAFFVMFIVSLIVLAILLAFTGLDTMTAISGAATALANIGPGLGDRIGPSGNFFGLNDAAKWLLIAGMLIGRLEVMSVYVLFTISFWRR